MLNWSTFGRLRKRLIVGIAFALVVACPASAQMYSDAELNTKLARIRSNLVATVEQDISTIRRSHLWPGRQGPHDRAASAWRASDGFPRHREKDQ